MITSIFLNNIYKIKSRIFLTFFHFKTIKDTLCISTNFKDTGLPTHPCIRNILRSVMAICEGNHGFLFLFACQDFRVDLLFLSKNDA